MVLHRFALSKIFYNGFFVALNSCAYNLKSYAAVLPVACKYFN